jgi:hypothetical protein
MKKNRLAISLLAFALPASSAIAQESGTPTQALIAYSSKAPVTLTPSNVTFKVDNRLTPVANLVPIRADGTQVALLIDDGLRTSVGRELNNLRAFIASLPQGTEVFVGYMQNGRVVPGGDIDGFTTNLAAAAKGLHIPEGVPGASASPYFCLSDFVKNWPSPAESASAPQQQPSHKAHIVLMITNGVDPYNGSTSITNQDSPYVTAAIEDAQRAGVPVYSIYFTDAGFRGGQSSFSGQSYLQQVADGTGGVAYYLGTGNPVSLAPFLTQFKGALAETYVATFPVDANKKLVTLKVATTAPKTKLRAPGLVRPGTIVLAQ